MRRSIFVLALVGLIYLGSSAYALYGQLVHETGNTRIVSYETIGGLPSRVPAPQAARREQGRGGTGLLAFILASPVGDDLRGAAVLICRPGLAVLTALSFIPDSAPEWIVAVIISWWVWGTMIRVTWMTCARFFGIGYTPEWFRHFLKLTPPWRMLYGLVRPVRRWARLLTFDKSETDKFAGLLETLYHVFRPGQILIGRLSVLNIGLFQPVGVPGERGLAMIAAPGAGKTVTLISILATYLGNIFCTDCDGQIINAIGRRLEALGKQVFKLDPYNLAPGFKSASWNPVYEIDDAVRRYGVNAAVEFAAALAEALIKTPSGGAGQNDWVYSEAKVFLLGLVLYVWKYAPPDKRNLVYLRTLLTRGQIDKARPDDDPFEVLVIDMKRRPDFEGVIATSGIMLERSMGGKSDAKSPVLATAIEQTAWLDFPRMQAVIKHSDFYCHDLKNGNASAFVVAPTVDLQSRLAPWNRVLTNMTLTAFQQDLAKRPKHATLFALDEFPHQGKNDIVLTMAGVGRKYGIKILVIAQTITQLQAVYGKSWSDFLGTADGVLWMANADQPTKEFLSNALGKITHEPMITGGALSSDDERAHRRREDRKLLTPGQLPEFLKTNMIFTRASDRAMVLKGAPYFNELPVTRYEADRNFRERLPRAFTRRVLRLLARLRNLTASSSTRNEQSPIR